MAQIFEFENNSTIFAGCVHIIMQMKQLLRVAGFCSGKIASKAKNKIMDKSIFGPKNTRSGPKYTKSGPKYTKSVPKKYQIRPKKDQNPSKKIPNSSQQISTKQKLDFSKKIKLNFFPPGPRKIPNA